MSIPRVSVIVPAYNHASFVASSIQSVLAQTFNDFELLVSDDGSTDDTAKVIAAIKDRRLTFFPNDVNRGACVVTNELVWRARGEYIAVLNSDDEWHPEKLERQLQWMEAHPSIGACFSRVEWIDKDGNALADDQIAFGKVFDQENRSQAAWLRHFLFSGNCLCHPSVLIRRRCYDALGLYDNRLRQLPDFDMWVRLLKTEAIHILDERLVRFRVLPGENASSPTVVNSRRSNNELFFIFSNFFDGISPGLMKDAFGDLMRNSEATDPIELACEKALLFFAEGFWNARMYQLIGLTHLHRLLGDPAAAEVLSEKYAIDDRYFHALAGNVTTFVPDAGDTSNSSALSAYGGRALFWAMVQRLRVRFAALFKV